ncbi:MAG: hypothetical protein ABSD31_06905 [Candidatus Binataceae bacterium]|jgi:integrase/recombinase XerD
MRNDKRRSFDLGQFPSLRAPDDRSRTQFFEALQRVAAQADAHLKAGERLTGSPHVLWHTFLRKLAEEKGARYAKEASGHRGDRYIWRYVKLRAQSIADPKAT